MTRTWLSRAAQLVKTAKKPTRPTHRGPRLGVEPLEDRAVPAAYTFDAGANTLSIALAADEALTVTADATNTTFVLTGGDGTPTFTQSGGATTASGDGSDTIVIPNADLGASLTITNAGAAATSNNDVTFAGGTVTTGALSVALTDTDGGTDLDDVTLSGGATLAAPAGLSTQNGSIAVNAGTAINAAAGGSIALTGGLAVTIGGALSASGAGVISLSVDPTATDVNPTVGGTVAVAPTAAITSGTAVQITGGGGDDTFDLAAQAGAALAVGGGAAATTSPGDTLTVRGTVNTFAAGAYTFTGAQTITYSGVETLGPTVSVAATGGAEGGADGALTFTRTGDLSQPLTVNFAIGGTSTATGADFALAAGANTTFTFDPATGTGTVTFAAGSGTASLVIDVTDDATAEATEVVAVSVTASAQGLYTASGTAGTAVAPITDNEAPVVSVAAAGGAEGGANGALTFTRVGDLSQALTVNFSVGSGSTAAFGSDYTLAAGANTAFTFDPATGTGTVTFAAGAATAALVVNVTDDSANEATEAVIASVGAATAGQYTVSATAGTATVSIADNDPNNGNGNGNNNGNNGVRTRARPAFSGAQIVGDRIVLFGPDGEVKAAVPVTPGTRVAFADLTGDGAGDVVMIAPQGAVVINGQTGAFAAVLLDFDGDRAPDLLLFSFDTGNPVSILFSRTGQTVRLA